MYYLINWYGWYFTGIHGNHSASWTKTKTEAKTYTSVEEANNAANIERCNVLFERAEKGGK